MSAPTPTIVVVGAGRVGTYLACKLARAGGRVLLKGTAPAKDRPASRKDGFVDALCAEAGVTFIREYDQCRGQAVDFVFVSVKTYSLPAVKAELDAHGLKPRIAILVHNGIVKPVFPTSVRVVIPQSYDFHETPGVGCGVAIHVKNEDKPWVGFGGYCPPRHRPAL